MHDVMKKLFCMLFPREAAEDAGFDVLRVISQPAAAALAYGKQLWISNQSLMLWILILQTKHEQYTINNGNKKTCYVINVVIHCHYTSYQHDDFEVSLLLK